MTRRWTATELLDLVLDAGSFESWDEPVDISGHPERYRRELEAAADEGGHRRVGPHRARPGPRPAGRRRGQRVPLPRRVDRQWRRPAGSPRAVRRATAEGLPVLAATASGGTRMQEGTPAFVEMVEISRALMAHRAAGLPYLVYLRHPTTGGVFASWGSLGHVTVAEPGALIGFLGPKVYEALNGAPFPAGVQTAENLAEHGVIDAVVPPEDLPALVDRALGVLVDPPVAPVLPRRRGSPRPAPAGLGRRSRSPAPRTGPESGSCCATARAGRCSCGAPTRASVTPPWSSHSPGSTDSRASLVGQDRTRQTPASPMGPAALREARRGMRLAEELGLPLVTVIDTPGAELSPRAEEGAIAGEIARCIATMTTMTVPTLSVLLGQGCGGGALALLPADASSPRSTPGCHRCPRREPAPSCTATPPTPRSWPTAQRIRAVDLLADGTVHHVVPEPADDSAEGLALAIAAECGARLQELRLRGRRQAPSEE